MYAHACVDDAKAEAEAEAEAEAGAGAEAGREAGLSCAAGEREGGESVHVGPYIGEI